MTRATTPRPAFLPGVPRAPGAPVPAEADVAALLRQLDAAGLELRISNPGRVVSVYATSPETTAAVTTLARVGRHTVPQLDWTVEFSPVETVLLVSGPDEFLGTLGLAAAA